ncbi:MAG: glycoside hydrolase family 127 protein [Akkermansiaceae bacterium]
MKISMKTFKQSQRLGLAAGVVMLTSGICLGGELEAFIAPSIGYKEVAADNVTWRGGFWGKRLDIHQKTTIPHVLDNLDERHHFRNFDVAAKVVAGERPVIGSDDPGVSLNPLDGDPSEEKTDKKSTGVNIVGNHAYDSDAHKGLEGACHLLCLHEDPALEKRVNDIIDRIVASQQKDGYMITYYTAKEPENRWRNLRLNHEMYCAGHFFELAVAHHHLTGNTKALDAAKRFADHIDGIFGSGKRYDVGGHQEIELALVKLYRATGEKRYLELSRFFLDERGHAHGTERKPFTDVPPRAVPERKAGEEMRDFRRRKWSTRNGRMQDHKPLLEQTEAVGHAVRAGYTYAAMVDIARFSDAPEYAKAVRTLWEDVVFRKMYLTGGLGTAQYADEGFGDPYLLPNKTYCESCASMASVFWQQRMTLMDGDAKYADVMELTLYNGAISGLGVNGDSFFYQNPLESPKGAKRTSWIGLACCPTNFARFIPQIGGYLYATNADDILVNLYGASDTNIVMDDGRKVGIRQETDFPWDGKVKMTITPESPRNFSLNLRIPNWANGHPLPGDLYRFADGETSPITLTVNGEAIAATPETDGYVHLERSWKSGDVIELSLPMEPRRVLSNEKIIANKGKVALMRGPVVYCLEGTDHPGIDLSKLTLLRDSDLKAEHRPDLLGGVTVLTGQAIDADGEAVELTAVPYYAWANREKGQMTVWIDKFQESE